MKIKNWASCIPEELRKVDFMAIHPFERIVWPRKLGSPFLKGVKGPGGIGESVERAEGEKIYGGGTGRKRPRRAVAPTSMTTQVSVSKPSNAATPNPTTTSATVSQQPQPAPLQIQPPSSQQLATQQKRIDDRTIITAAGGISALGPSPLTETLSPQTGLSFILFSLNYSFDFLTSNSQSI